MKKDDDIERIKAYMEAKMKHIKMYNECMNLADGLDVAKFAELVRADEREACAKVCENLWVPEDGNYHWIPDGRGALQSATEAIRARGDVHAIDISQERVDETAKHKHEEKHMTPLDELGIAITDAGYTWTPEMRKAYEKGVRQEKREWVGFTEEEAWEMLRQMSLGASVEDVRFIEAKLKEKNCG
jgi:hypothetical protein